MWHACYDDAVKVSAFLLLATALLTQATLGQSKADPAKFAGEYVQGHQYGAGKLILRPDGTFNETAGSDDGTNVTTTGTFQVTEGKLLFSNLKSIGHRGETELTLDPKDDKDFSMHLIEWSGRVYLLSESDVARFVDAVNLHIEPRNAPYCWDMYGCSWLGAFYLRKGDEKKKVAGPPPLPQPWRDMLLARPVTARVIKIDKVDKGKFYTESSGTINKGRRAGLKVGHKLVSPRQYAPNPHMAEVVSVSKERRR